MAEGGAAVGAPASGGTPAAPDAALALEAALLAEARAGLAAESTRLVVQERELLRLELQASLAAQRALRSRLARELASVSAAEAGRGGDGAALARQLAVRPPAGESARGEEERGGWKGALCPLAALGPAGWVGVMDLSRGRIARGSLEAVALHMAALERLEFVDLSCSDLGDESAPALRALLCGRVRLRGLAVRDNPELGVEAADALADGLRQQSALEFFDASGCRFDPPHARGAIAAHAPDLASPPVAGEAPALSEARAWAQQGARARGRLLDAAMGSPRLRHLGLSLVDLDLAPDAAACASMVLQGPAKASPKKRPAAAAAATTRPARARAPVAASAPAAAPAVVSRTDPARDEGGSWHLARWLHRRVTHEAEAEAALHSLRQRVWDAYWAGAAAAAGAAASAAAAAPAPEATVSKSSKTRAMRAPAGKAAPSGKVSRAGQSGKVPAELATALEESVRVPEAWVWGGGDASVSPTWTLQSLSLRGSSLSHLGLGAVLAGLPAVLGVAASASLLGALGAPVPGAKKKKAPGATGVAAALAPGARAGRPTTAPASASGGKKTAASKGGAPALAAPPADVVQALTLAVRLWRPLPLRSLDLSATWTGARGLERVLQALLGAQREPLVAREEAGRGLAATAEGLRAAALAPTAAARAPGRLHALRSLDLTQCGLGGADGLCEVVRRAPWLQRLVVRCNPLGPEACSQLADAVADGDGRSSLRVLDAACTRGGDAGDAALAGALERNASLVTVAGDDMGATEEALAAQALALAPTVCCVVSVAGAERAALAHLAPRVAAQVADVARARARHPLVAPVLADGHQALIDGALRTRLGGASAAAASAHPAGAPIPVVSLGPRLLRAALSSPPPEPASATSWPAAADCQLPEDAAWAARAPALAATHVLPQAVRGPLWVEWAQTAACFAASAASGPLPRPVLVRAAARVQWALVRERSGMLSVLRSGAHGVEGNGAASLGLARSLAAAAHSGAPAAAATAAAAAADPDAVDHALPAPASMVMAAGDDAPASAATVLAWPWAFHAIMLPPDLVAEGDVLQVRLALFVAPSSEPAALGFCDGTLGLVAHVRDLAAWSSDAHAVAAAPSIDFSA